MTQPAEYCVDLAHVTKNFGRKIRALDGISMRIPHGQAFGLLGPNGAGKSTLVKIMMTVVRPTRAEGTVMGRPIGHKESLRRIGYLPEHHRFPPYLTGRGVLEFYGALSGMPRRRRRLRSLELLESVGMSKWGGTVVEKYSKGMRQRIGLAQALMHDPDLIVLDEPTDGVDPIGRRDIRDVLHRLNEQGKTLLVNSHLLSEVEQVCQQIAILVKGRVIKQGTIAELTAETRRLEIECSGSEPLPGLDAPWRISSPTPGRTLLVGPGLLAESAQDVLDRIRREGRVIHRVQEVGESLEDLFVRSVTDSTPGAEGAV